MEIPSLQSCEIRRIRYNFPSESKFAPKFIYSRSFHYLYKLWLNFFTWVFSWPRSVFPGLHWEISLMIISSYFSLGLICRKTRSGSRCRKKIAYIKKPVVYRAEAVKNMGSKQLGKELRGLFRKMLALYEKYTAGVFNTISMYTQLPIFFFFCLVL